MGYINSASTLTLTAKLTPYGRQQLLLKGNNLITHFGLGDSDANYNTTGELTTGEIPDMCGIVNNSNSISSNYALRSKIILNASGETKKLIESASATVNSASINNGSVVLTNSDLTFDIIDRTNLTAATTNYFYSFGLPITEADKFLFSGVTNNNGGFYDTALRTLNADKALVIGIDDSKYGEIIDGKSIKVELQTLSNSYTIYSTYQRTLTPLATQDVQMRDLSPKAAFFGNNVSMLFSDEIKRPNNSSFKTWATAYNTVRPFTNGKELFNITNNTGQSLVVDEAVGISHLDKGFIVITNSTIVDDFDVNNLSANTITLSSSSTEISQDITCIINRGEFVASTNPTYRDGDMLRISEVGLYDELGELVAVAKIDKQVVVGATQFFAVGIKITV